MLRNLCLAPIIHQYIRIPEWFASVDSCRNTTSNAHNRADKCISTIEFLFLDLVKFLSLFNQVVGKSFKCLKINFIHFLLNF